MNSGFYSVESSITSWEKREVPLLSQLLFLSDGENNGNICTEPLGTSLSYFETTGMELSTANVTNSQGFQGWEVSQVEAGQLCESSSQGNLESAPVTLCPAQAVLCPGQWP